MRITIPVQCQDGRRELWDTKLMETYMTLQTKKLAEQPKVSPLERSDAEGFIHQIFSFLV